MTDGRVSRAGSQALIQFQDPEGRVSRAGAQALIQFQDPEARVARAGVQVLILPVVTTAAPYWGIDAAIS